MDTQFLTKYYSFVNLIRSVSDLASSVCLNYFSKCYYLLIVVHYFHFSKDVLITKIKLLKKKKKSQPC